MRSPALLALSGALCACTTTPFVVLQFPDAESEAAGAELTVLALAPLEFCATLMAAPGLPTTTLASATARLPLTDALRLGKLAKGAAVFLAEVRDPSGTPILRGCREAVSGNEVLITFQHLLKPVKLKEGETLSLDVRTRAASGEPLKLNLVGAPLFVRWDPAARTLHFTPGPADQGVYAFTLEPVETVDGAFVLHGSVTVEDVSRPLKWERLYRGWHGRFDAAALWDPRARQLLTSGGRDVGVDLSVRTLYTPSNPPDVLSDWRVLSFATPTPDWRPNRVTRPGNSGKFGHVMGWATSPSGTRWGFVLGGSDGAQITSESLLIDVGMASTAMVPSLVDDSPRGTGFYTHMAAAPSPDARSTYLFGGVFGDQHVNELREVTVTDTNVLTLRGIPASFTPRPAVRSHAAMVMATNPKRLVVIGGRMVDATSAVLYGDAWVLCLEVSAPKCPPGSVNQWTRVLPSGDTFPGSGSEGVFGVAAGYDAPRDRVVTYGGLGVVANQTWLFEDAFELDLSASVPQGDGGLAAPWRKLPAPGGPLGLVGTASALDADAGRLLIYAGCTGRVLNGSPQLDLLEEVWALGLTPGSEKLTRVSTVGTAPFPSRRVGATLTARTPYLFLGGTSEGALTLDEWRVEPDGGVSAISTGPFAPWPRENMATVYNPDLGEHWLYGGRDGTLLPLAALFRYTADGGFTVQDQLDEGGNFYDPRFGAAAIYDLKNHHMVVFGGIGVTPLGTTGSRNDVLVLSLQGTTLVTTRVTPAGDAPTPRYGSIAGYDFAGQRMVIYGGTAQVVASEVDSNELWELSLVPGQERWRIIEPGGDRPKALYLPAGAMTKENPPRFYVLGTVERPAGMRPALVDELWRLDLDATAPTWTKLARPDFRPRPRVFPAFTYDDENNRLLLGGGATDPVFRNDVWGLTLP